MHFSSNRLQSLYDIVNSDHVRQMKNTNDIKNALYEPIMAVLQNDAALDEARNWKMFYSVIRHYEDVNYREYQLMDRETSMCMSLYMYVRR